MDSYKQIIREMAQATLDEGLLSPADITPRIMNCQSIIRYATGPEFSKVRMQAQAGIAGYWPGPASGRGRYCWCNRCVRSWRLVSGGINRIS